MNTQDETVYLPGDLQIVEGRVGEAVTLAAYGEIDMATAPELDAALLRAEESDAAQIILDLSAVTFIDSCGLRVVLVAERRSATDGKRLGMRLGDGQVARMMKFTAIDQMVNVLDLIRSRNQSDGIRPRRLSACVPRREVESIDRPVACRETRSARPLSAIASVFRSVCRSAIMRIGPS